MQFTRLDPMFAAGPQIGLGDVASIAAAGFVGLVNNRPDGEDPSQPAAAAIAAEAARLGLKYWHIPVKPSGLTEDDARALAEALRAAGGPVFAFCRSGTRSSNLWKAARQIP